jgi:pectate disaccharide-lyase
VGASRLALAAGGALAVIAVAAGLPASFGGPPPSEPSSDHQPVRRLAAVSPATLYGLGTGGLTVRAVVDGRDRVVDLSLRQAEPASVLAHTVRRLAHGGLVRVTWRLGRRTLARMRAGTYTLAVRSGRSAQQLGGPTMTTGVRVAQPFARRALHVARTGSDAGPCSRSRPCRTLGRADSLATPGTTVLVRSGVYGSATLRASGTRDRRVRFVSRRRWGAEIVGSIKLAGAYTDFAGFEVRGGSKNTLVELAGSNTRALGNRVHGLPISCASPDGGAGIDATGASAGAYRGSGQEIVGNVVYDIGAGARDGTCSLVHGIYSSVPDVRIANNLVYRVTGWGIHSWHAATANTVVNNTVAETGAGGIVVGHGDVGASVQGNTGTFVANNLIAATRGVGIAERTAAGARVGDNIYIDNLVWNAPIALGIGPSSVVKDTVAANPRFIDRARDDYRLRSASPAIDRGTTEMAPSTDIDGLPRRNSGGVDIGAYER